MFPLSELTPKEPASLGDRIQSLAHIPPCVDSCRRRWLLENYPTRFSDERNPYVVQALKGDLPGVGLFIPKTLIDAGDVAPIADILLDMVSTREKATAFRQRVAVMTDGYDDDPRGLWEIAEARQFFRRLFEECPFVMLLATPEAGLLRLLAACWLWADPQLGPAEERERLGEFLDRAFVGLNEVVHRLAFSDELTRAVSLSAARALLPDGAMGDTDS